MMKWLLPVTAVASAILQTGGQQQSRQKADWPCGARVDPAYFHLSEATGGHLFLLAPFEVGDSAPLMLAVGDHPQTIFRLAGSITPGVHEFTVPIDSSVESVVFSLSVQCLQVADVLDPSGAPPSGIDVSDYSNFRAERMVIVKRPLPGAWTLRAGGSGITGVMVQARSAIALTGVEFASSTRTAFQAIPIAGVENVVRMHVTGDVRDLRASIVNAAFKATAQLPLTPSDTAGTFISRFSPGPAGFRVAISGKNADGSPLQRVHAALFTAR